MERAKKSDWKTVDMPEECERFMLDDRLTDEEFARIQMGRVPRAMEDKWFVYFEGDALYIHRSWTGYCIYIIRFDGCEADVFDGCEADVFDGCEADVFSGGHAVAGVTVNRNPDQNPPSRVEKDRMNVRILIGMFAGRPPDVRLMKEYLKA